MENTIINISTQKINQNIAAIEKLIYDKRSYIHTLNYSDPEVARGQQKIAGWYGALNAWEIVYKSIT